jgi:hypothetical protein
LFFFLSEKAILSICLLHFYKTTTKTYAHKKSQFQQVVEEVKQIHKYILQYKNERDFLQHDAYQ